MIRVPLCGGLAEYSAQSPVPNSVSLPLPDAGVISWPLLRWVAAKELE